MATLPGYDAFAEENKLSSNSKSCIAASQYIVIVSALLILIWLGYNIVTILGKQRKFRVLPLLVFYTVGTILTLSRLYNAIWIW